MSVERLLGKYIGKYVGLRLSCGAVCFGKLERGTDEISYFLQEAYEAGSIRTIDSSLNEYLYMLKYIKEGKDRRITSYEILPENITTIKDISDRVNETKEKLENKQQPFTDPSEV